MSGKKNDENKATTSLREWHLWRSHHLHVKTLSPLTYFFFSFPPWEAFKETFLSLRSGKLCGQHTSNHRNVITVKKCSAGERALLGKPETLEWEVPIEVFYMCVYVLGLQCIKQVSQGVHFVVQCWHCCVHFHFPHERPFVFSTWSFLLSSKQCFDPLQC